MIFGNYFESFRNTRISDDSGIFRNDFHIFDFKPGICLFNSFILSPRGNIFSLSFLFLFPFSLIHFLPPQAKVFLFSKIPLIPHSHLLPHLISLFLSLPWPAKWPSEGHLTLSLSSSYWLGEDTSSLPIYTKPLSSILIPLPSQIPILYKFLFYISPLFFLTSPKEKSSSPKSLLHLKTSRASSRASSRLHLQPPTPKATPRSSSSISSFNYFGLKPSSPPWDLFKYIKLQVNQSK